MAKEFFRSFALMAFPFLASLLIRFLYLSNKKVFNSPEVIPDEPTIFACWHGELLMLPYLYKRYRKKPHAKVLISDHFDGKLIAKTITYFGLDTIHGSSTRNASRVLIQGIKAIKDGYDIGITPDGPKGPRHEVSDGVLALAQKTGAKVILASTKPTKYWLLDSWDRFCIPKPFGTLIYYSTPPIDISGMSLEEAREIVKQGLLKYDNRE